MTDTDPRLQQLGVWLQRSPAAPVARMEPASADASFRRYFRVWCTDGSTRIAMDAPPDKEALAPFVHVARLLERCGAHVPHLESVDEAAGFALMEDLGGTHFLAHLQSGADPATLYGEALAALRRIQLGGRELQQELPRYDAVVLEREMRLMPEWFCGRHLQRVLDEDEQQLIDATFAFLVREALAQPRVFVHRDYHSRNLMITPRRSPGIIDFQDALSGPVGYDLVSLLKDCYVSWPRAQVERWLAEYRAALILEGGAELAGVDDAQFLRWFDLIGLQRHIKVLGIFARLWYRDGKSGYLADLPLTLHYVRDTARRYPELAAFSAWLEARVAPLLAAANAREQESVA
ncbi:MAG: phosphotransferase [Steroidobacteraceae bacterium]